jgi:cation:H+ antiporter
MAIVLFVLGLILLIVGADVLVRGASRLAGAFGISPLIVGLTVVAFGTSSPELAVSVKSALSGQGNIALGNVIGSNIFNVLFILGLSALIVPLVVSYRLIRLDVPLMVGLSFLVLVFALNGVLSRLEGLMLVAGLVGYIGFSIYEGRKEQSADAAEGSGGTDARAGGWLKNSAFVIGGLFLLIIGSRWLVDSAVTFAQLLGVSELVIGLTIVAAGTSLPEVVTSIIAAMQGERDIAVGNVIGSNIFNILGVLGVASVVAPEGIEVARSVIRFDIPVMLAVAVACLPIFFTGAAISRREGAVFFAYYIAYTVFLVLMATNHVVVPWFTAAMVYFVLPLTAITLLSAYIRERRLRRR